MQLLGYIHAYKIILVTTLHNFAFSHSQTMAKNCTYTNFGARKQRIKLIKNNNHVHLLAFCAFKAILNFYLNNCVHRYSKGHSLTKANMFSVM